MRVVHEQKTQQNAVVNGLFWVLVIGGRDYITYITLQKARTKNLVQKT